MRLFNMLVEANVLNIDLPYNNISINKYLANIFKDVPESPIKQQLVKKLARLIVNDNRFLEPVEELPKNAPEWATAALERGELFAFNPSEDLADQLSHMTHFIIALVTDTASNNPDVKAFAVTELNGLPKVENMDVLMKKANAYFARGSKSVERSAEGLEHVMDCDRGYAWFRIVTPDAFRREGQILQNCIGRNYTADSLKRSGETILILRDRNQNSCVAMRFTGGNQVMEIKGKNNAPPVPRYMPAVKELIDARDLKFTSTAMYDIRGAGYWAIDNKIMPFQEAVKLLLPIEEVATLPSGCVVSRLVPKDLNVFRDLYSDYSNRAYLNRKEKITCYQLSKGTAIVATALVNSTQLQDLWSPDDDRAKPSKKQNQSVIELVNYLSANNGFDSVQADLNKPLLLQHKMVIQPGGKGLTPLKADEEVDITGDDGDTVQVEIYKDETAKSYGGLAFDGNTYRSREGTKYSKPSQIKQVYSIPYSAKVSDYARSDSFKSLMIIETNDHHIFFYGVTNQGTAALKALSPGVPAERAIIQAAIQLANAKNLTIPMDFALQSGITKDDDGYKQYQMPIKKIGNQFFKIDLSAQNNRERASGLLSSYVLDSSGTPSRMSNNRGNGQFNNVFQDYNREAPPLAPEYNTDESVLTELNKVITNKFGGVFPAFIYYCDTVMPGNTNKHLWVFANENKKIINVDVGDYLYNNKDKARRSLHGAERKVANAQAFKMNALIKDEGLVIDQSVFLKTPYFQVRNNVVTTPSERAGAQFDTRVSANTMSFANNISIRPMTKEEFAVWQEEIREGMIENKVPYVIIKDQKPVFAFFVHNGRISSYFESRKIDGVDGSLPTFRTWAVDTQLAPYIRAFASANDLKYPNKTGNIKRGNRYGTYLIGAEEGDVERGALLYRAGYRERNIGTINTTSNFFDRWMVEMGLIRVRHQVTMVGARRTRERHHDYVSLTEKGKQVVARLKAGEVVSPYELSPAATPVGEYEKAVQTAPVRPAAAPGEAHARPSISGTREGSKAALAVARFRELAAGGTPPSRGDFIRILLQPPFNMTQAGASTYYHNIKMKWVAAQQVAQAQAVGRIGERFSFKEFLMVTG